jgi:hypothetical protein
MNNQRAPGNHKKITESKRSKLPKNIHVQRNSKNLSISSKDYEDEFEANEDKTEESININFDEKQNISKNTF